MFLSFLFTSDKCKNQFTFLIFTRILSEWSLRYHHQQTKKTHQSDIIFISSPDSCSSWGDIKQEKVIWEFAKRCLPSFHPYPSHWKKKYWKLFFNLEMSYKRYCCIFGNNSRILFLKTNFLHFFDAILCHSRRMYSIEKLTAKSDENNPIISATAETVLIPLTFLYLIWESLKGDVKFSRKTWNQSSQACVYGSLVYIEGLVNFTTFKQDIV